MVALSPVCLSDALPESHWRTSRQWRPSVNSSEPMTLSSRLEKPAHQRPVILNRAAGIRWILILAGIGWMFATFLGVVHTRDTAYPLALFTERICGTGLFSFGLYLIGCLILVPYALWACLQVIGRLAGNGAVLGSLVGLTAAVYLFFLQLALAFFGDHANVPGLPIALARFGDARIAKIWASALAINGAVYGGLGCFTGFLVCRWGRRAEHSSSSGVQTPDRRATRRIIILCATASSVVALLLGGVLWSEGPGRQGLDAFRAQFDLVPGISSHHGLIYTRAGDTDLRLDLCMPDKGHDARPAVLCIHGGGWHGGVRSEYIPLIVQLAREGYVAASVEYRLAPAHRFPAQFEDVASAVRWLRANSKQYNIDPQRIGVLGWSAGGHLACLLGTTGGGLELEGPATGTHGLAGVQAVVSFSGLTDLTADYWKTVPSGAQKLIGASLEDDPDAYRRASAISHVDRDDPPFLFLHGADDAAVPLDQSRRLLKALDSAGVEATLEVFSGTGHRWYGATSRSATKLALRFLDRHLSGAVAGDEPRRPASGHSRRHVLPVRISASLQSGWVIDR